VFPSSTRPKTLRRSFPRVGYLPLVFRRLFFSCLAFLSSSSQSIIVSIRPDLFFLRPSFRFGPAPPLVHLTSSAILHAPCSHPPAPTLYSLRAWIDYTALQHPNRTHRVFCSSWHLNNTHSHLCTICSAICHNRSTSSTTHAPPRKGCHNYGSLP